VILVAVAAHDGHPVVVDRRRVELADPELPSQPYHHEALDLDLGAAEELIRVVKQSVSSWARKALAQLRSDLESSSDVAALTLREPRTLPSTLTEILASRPALYIADSEMYREALHQAAQDLSIPVVSHPRSGEFELGARALDIGSDELSTFVRSQRKTLGPPWQKDHHTATAAAIGALAERMPLRLPRS
jgi:hypothetical protein